MDMNKDKIPIRLDQVKRSLVPFFWIQAVPTLRVYVSKVVVANPDLARRGFDPRALKRKELVEFLVQDEPMITFISLVQFDFEV